MLQFSEFVWAQSYSLCAFNNFLLTDAIDRSKISSDMLQFSEFVWALSYLVQDVFNNFLLIDGTDRNKIISDQKRLFIALSL